MLTVVQRINNFESKKSFSDDVYLPIYWWLRVLEIDMPTMLEVDKLINCIELVRANNNRLKKKQQAIKVEKFPLVLRSLQQLKSMFTLFNLDNSKTEILITTQNFRFTYCRDNT